MSNNLRRLMRQGRYTVTFDQDFEQVIAACAARRGRWHLTWITPRIMRVYADAFDAGEAHSFEVWNAARWSPAATASPPAPPSPPSCSSRASPTPPKSA